ncbi:hypothetical protein B0181_07885 [Moraxella caviae]|uniref:Uncharacterized protein n=1 Tax=Moraxella caviae TaxID=34060 RepID=A0A1S9ZYZ1_9GAMM|nr:hypothetical protein [Moraxella caviae]OOR88627.1 hypothetical protein B0181_07885 [Moraxella caviae]STZ13690.1 Uncharacterised protein [Moraxella caviae]
MFKDFEKFTAQNLEELDKMISMAKILNDIELDKQKFQAEREAERAKLEAEQEQNRIQMELARQRYEIDRQKIEAEVAHIKKQNQFFPWIAVAIAIIGTVGVTINAIGPQLVEHFLK